MKLKFYFQTITWKNSEIHFVGGFLSNGRKNFQVDGLKRTVTKGESLYLCRIWETIGHNSIDTFKFFVLNNLTKENFLPENIQLVGQNVNNQFILDKEFQEGMGKSNSSSIKLDLSGDYDSQANSKRPQKVGRE